MIEKLLIANRGEIAIRIMRTAANLGIQTLAIYSKDDADSLHVFRADEAVCIDGEGAAAYLDSETIVSLAKDNACDAIHPGYGFLSENADFATACSDKGIAFVGPTPETLRLFGDKGEAREFAISQDVPVLKGTQGATSQSEAAEFLQQQSGAPVILKAISGGGGRGVRIVADAGDLEAAYTQSAREAASAFGNDALYVEEYMQEARHIEVQILGDGTGRVTALGERDCSLQRRHQKIIEIAPAPGLEPDLRERIIEAAVKLAKAAAYRLNFWLIPRREDLSLWRRMLACRLNIQSRKKYSVLIW